MEFLLFSLFFPSPQQKKKIPGTEISKDMSEKKKHKTPACGLPLCGLTLWSLRPPWLWLIFFLVLSWTQTWSLLRVRHSDFKRGWSEWQYILAAYILGNLHADMNSRLGVITHQQLGPHTVSDPVILHALWPSYRVYIYIHICVCVLSYMCDYSLLTAYLHWLTSVGPHGRNSQRFFLSHCIKIHLWSDQINCLWGFKSTRKKENILNGASVYIICIKTRWKPRSPGAEEDQGVCPQPFPGCREDNEPFCCWVVCWNGNMPLTGEDGGGWGGLCEQFLLGREESNSRVGVDRRRFRCLGSSQYPIWWVTAEQPGFNLNNQCWVSAKHMW